MFIKTKATTATDVDATQIATREIKMTGGFIRQIMIISFHLKMEQHLKVIIILIKLFSN